MNDKLELVEPTFVLRASDPLAASLVRQWARRREIAVTKRQAPPGDLADVERARQLALDMERWRRQDAVRIFSATLKKFGERFGARRPAEVIKFPRSR